MPVPTMPVMPLRSERRPRRSRAAVWLALLLLIAAASAVALQQHGRNESGAEISPLRQDTALLWTWADPVLEGGSSAAAWSLRWEGLMTAGETDRLAARLTLRQEETAGETYGRRYSGGEGGRTVLWRQSETADNPVPVILLDGERPGEGREALAARIAGVEAALRQAAPSQRFRASAALRARSTGAPEDILAKLAGAADARLVERYDDAGTVSAVYEAPALRASAVSAGQTVNLQAAVHADTEGGAVDVTIGVPLITGDYSLK